MAFLVRRINKSNCDENYLKLLKIISATKLQNYRLPKFRKVAAEQRRKEEEGTPVFNFTNIMARALEKLDCFTIGKKNSLL